MTTISAPKCQNSGDVSPEEGLPSKPDPLDPKNIAESILRLINSINL